MQSTELIWAAIKMDLYPTFSRRAQFRERLLRQPLPKTMSMLEQKRVLVQGLIILDHYADRFDAFRRDMGEWVAANRVKLREDVIDGLENAPAAFIGLLEGRNFGKLMVRVAAE